jgi:hypothetical protein
MDKLGMTYERDIEHVGLAHELRPVSGRRGPLSPALTRRSAVFPNDGQGPTRQRAPSSGLPLLDGSSCPDAHDPCSCASDELGASATRSRGLSLRQGDAEAGDAPVVALGPRPTQVSGRVCHGRLPSDVHATPGRTPPWTRILRQAALARYHR